MTKTKTTVSLKPRRQTGHNLKQYIHTRGFNQLAGRMAMEPERPEISPVFPRFLLCLLAALFFGIGLYFALF